MGGREPDQSAGPAAWIDDRIRHRPGQRHIWRPLKRLLQEDAKTADRTRRSESTVNQEDGS